MKDIYRVIGTDITRSTDRTYSHAVVKLNEAGEPDWAVNYCGTLALAEKALRQTQKYNSRYPNSFKILPVEKVIKATRR